MCGINGIFSYRDTAVRPSERELLKTREHMRARGPDDHGTWWTADRRCALAHRRLSIIDLSARAAQPMVSADGALVITFNGEIYNYRQLRKQLESDGVLFVSNSDTEVLLHLYARDGAKMVHRLRGMFAFAIWDQRQKALFLARDPYGIKPLYTADDGKVFRFASQVKALVGGGQISSDLNPAGLCGFLVFGHVPEPFTLYRHVRALPAGHTQWIDASGPQSPVRYTAIAEILSEGTRHSIAKPELPQRLRNLALESVRAHLLADVEIGLFLSAGVDSGSLLGLMRDAGQLNIRAITLAFDEFRDTGEDEGPGAARIAQRYGAQHILRRVSKKEFWDDLPAIFEAMDQPSIDGLNTWFIAKAAKEAGLKVALSGIGGDELLAGYPSFVKVPRWHRRFGGLAKIRGLAGPFRAFVSTFAPRFAQLSPKALGMFDYSDTWSGAYFLQRALFLPDEIQSIIDPHLARQGLQELEPVCRLAAELVPDPGSDVARICALESSHYLRNQLLRDADWAGMAHSVEIRVPFVDTELLKGLAPVLGNMTPGEGKAALAHAPSQALPEETVIRDKTGFGVPTNAWIRNVGVTSAPFSTVDPKGLISRRWSRIVLSKVISADKYNGALAA